MAWEWPEFPAELRLQQTDLDDIHTKYGTATLVRRAVVCGCMNPETRLPNPNHAPCAGWGLLYPAALELEDTPVEWISNSVQARQNDAGFTQLGDFTVNWPSTISLGLGDLFVHPHEETSTHAILVKGQLDPDGDTLERLPHRYITAVDYITDGDNVYAAVADFNLHADGRRIVWVGGRGPAAGRVYTVRYRFRSEYRIWDQMPKVRDDGPSNRLTYAAQVFRFDPVSKQAGKNLGEGTEA